MPLSGVNKLCAQCTEKCKQWEQITVVSCPCFKSNQKPMPHSSRGIPFKHNETRQDFAGTRILESHSKIAKTEKIDCRADLSPFAKEQLTTA
jgi:hypothetical protein